MAFTSEREIKWWLFKESWNLEQHSGKSRVTQKALTLKGINDDNENLIFMFTEEQLKNFKRGYVEISNLHCKGKVRHEAE